MNINAEITQCENLTSWIATKVGGLVISSQDRYRISAGCFDMVLEHQEAIVLLSKKSLFGSAASLVRSQFEAHIRGVYFHFCATEAEVEQFKNDRLDKNFGELISAIEKIETYGGGTFSRVKERSWKIMNSLTHTGFYQVTRRNTENEIGPDYSKLEVLDTLSTANTLAILAGVEIANMAEDEPLTREIADYGIKNFSGALKQKT